MVTASYSPDNSEQGLTISEGRKLVLLGMLALAIGPGCKLIDWFVKGPLDSVKKSQEDQNGEGSEAKGIIRTACPTPALSGAQPTYTILTPDQTATSTPLPCDPNNPRQLECHSK